MVNDFISIGDVAEQLVVRLSEKAIKSGNLKPEQIIRCLKKYDSKLYKKYIRYLVNLHISPDIFNSDEVTK
tara:strand:+ start:1979 stop:2191 length:213 start_codon:yes stop_codon:yes gene_type:complete